jgi:PAS domain S-box-containing protein
MATKLPARLKAAERAACVSRAGAADALDRMQTVHRLDQAEQALREREVAFAALAKVAPVGLMRFDAEGRCNYVNDRWSELSGLTIDEAIGEGWLQAVHIEDRASVAYRWASIRERDVPFREEYRVGGKGRVVHWVLAEGSALRGYDGELLGFIRTLVDITRHRELEAELLAAREDLEQRVKERTADLEAEMSERQRLEKEVLQAKENEQRRFSRDLHDGLGQCLTGVLFHALALERDLSGEGSSSSASAAKIAELVDGAINQAHDLARGIYPVPLRPDGLICALRDLVATICEAHPVRCSFECDEPVLVDDVEIATHLYRIGQEAITNAIKHSKGSNLIVRVEQCRTTITLCVSDDGVGLSQHETNGRGLNIMKHRARLLGASLHIEGAPDGGTTVRCVCKSSPLDHEKNDASKSESPAGR